MCFKAQQTLSTGLGGSLFLLTTVKAHDGLRSFTQVVLILLPPVLPHSKYNQAAQTCPTKPHIPSITLTFTAPVPSAWKAFPYLLYLPDSKSSLFFFSPRLSLNITSFRKLPAPMTNFAGFYYATWLSADITYTGCTHVLMVSHLQVCPPRSESFCLCAPSIRHQISTQRREHLKKNFFQEKWNYKVSLLWCKFFLKFVHNEFFGDFRPISVRERWKR